MVSANGEVDMDQVRECAARWMTVAADLGWGIEGPEDAASITKLVGALAEGRTGDGTDVKEKIAARKLGTRPVDALYEAASLLLSASATTGVLQGELLSAARGWLRIAVRRTP